MLLLALLSIAGLILVFLKGWDEHVAATPVYVLSAYTLTVWCFFFVSVVPMWMKNAKKKLYDHPVGNKYMTDIGYKVRVSLYISLAINMMYSVFKLSSGIYYTSFWWGAVAVYYILLSIIRFLLLRYMRSEGQNTAQDWKRYRWSGYALLLIHLSLSGIVAQMVHSNTAAVYPEVIIITSATYTFYTVTMSVLDIVKYRKYNNPAYSAAKAIRLASALVSLLTMETTMLASFGEDEGFRQLMTGLTGAGVCVIVLAMSLYMIIRSTREIRKVNKGV